MWLGSYSNSDSDLPDEMDSPEYITSLPATSPFLYTDSSKASDSSDGPSSQDPYAITVARWRSRVTAHSSSPSDFPIVPVTASLEIRRRAAILIRPREAIPLGRPYRTRLDAPDQAYSGSSTRVVSPRLGYPPVRALRHSESFRCWCAVPLSTFYPPTTSESSSGDSSERLLHSSLHSVGPSRKRCRFKDSYSSETSMEDDTEIDTTETEDGRELDIVDRDDVRDHVKIDPKDVSDDTEEYEADTSAGDTVKVGIDPMSAPVADKESEEPAGEDSSDSSAIRDGIVRSFEDMPIDLDDVVRDFYHHISEVCIDRIVGIETVQRWLEADQLIASGERARMTERIESLRSKKLKVRALLCIERDRVDNLRLYMSRSQEEFRQIRDDRDDLKRRLRRLESFAERRMEIEMVMVEMEMEKMVMDRVEMGMEMEEAIDL
uniref:Uncharacterized protein n=1 Tax=Tanacetum cinerariifolium TaxID=118510 RepID=A0A699GV30_TANCI|nr:hypothetical protein [Tanacetum cinerariifolium]